jgi:DNA-directed RNA polymerase I, II, and III subunit RPABC3
LCPSARALKLSIQINTDLWPLRTDETFTFVLASSLSTSDGADGANGVEGENKDQAPSWRLDAGKSMGLADEYDYVMYGKVYKFDGAAAERVWVGQPPLSCPETRAEHSISSPRS